MSPLAIDLFCGLGGWTEGLLAEGYDVVGFDIERHEYWGPSLDDMPLDASGGKGTSPVAKRGMTQGCAVSLGLEGANRKPGTTLHQYPAQLVIQDVLTLHGSQFRSADLIVASPPCQEYSWMAMPWSRAKAVARALRGEGEFPEGYRGSRTIPELTALFDACFRIQREASEAAGRHIPMVVENVRGAQPWVGRARWSYGSFYLWGDVPALMPMIKPRAKSPGLDWNGFKNGDPNYKGQAFNPAAQGKTLRERLEIKNTGGSWFNIAHNTTSGKGQNPDGRKNGNDWFGSGEDCSLQRRAGSKSSARKFASAMIAKIPLALSRHIAATYRPIAA